MSKKTYPTSPKKLLTRVLNHKKDRIFLSHETCRRCRANPPAGFYILAMDDDIVLDGVSCCRLEVVKNLKTGEELYRYPSTGKIRLY